MPPGAAHVWSQLTTVVPAPPEQVWAWLVRAPVWPRWYANARRVRLPPGQRCLSAATTFDWTTFGLPVSARVTVASAPRELGWHWELRPLLLGRLAHGYHGWRLDPCEGGTRVVTEEAVLGPLALVGSAVGTPVLDAGHRLWLNALGRHVRHGAPELLR